MEYEVKNIKTEKYDMPYILMHGGPKNMIVIPGMGFRPISSSPEGFVNAFSSFLDEYTIYLFDRKQNMDDDYSIKDRSDDIIDACKKLGLKNLYVYGASMGGFITQHMCIDYPEMIKKAVIASASYYLNEIGEDFMDNIIKYGEEKDVKNLVAFSIRRIYSKEFNDLNHEGIMKTYADMNEYEIKQYEEDAIAFKKEGYLLKDLEKVETDILLIASKEDNVFGYEPTLLMAYKIKNNECVIYDGYSHGVYDEAPDFRDRMRAFFDKK